MRCGRQPGKLGGAHLWELLLEAEVHFRRLTPVLQMLKEVVVAVVHHVVVEGILQVRVVLLPSAAKVKGGGSGGGSDGGSGGRADGLGLGLGLELGLELGLGLGLGLGLRLGFGLG